MEATQLLSSSTHFQQSFCLISLGRKSHVRRPVMVKARKGANYGRDYWDNTVDENMIILRKRIKEMNMLEKSSSDDEAPYSDWMEWEKQYYVHYNEDVCEAMGLLQNYLMNVRPSLGIGTLVLITFCMLFSAGVVSFHALEMAKGIISGFHFI